MSASALTNIEGRRCEYCTKEFKLGDDLTVVLTGSRAVYAETMETLDEVAAFATTGIEPTKKLCAELDWTGEHVYHSDCYEEVNILTTETYRDHLLNQVRKYKGFSQDEIAEYRDEAEHQESIWYWRQFRTWKQLASDIRRYIEAKNRA